ncbi:MerR family transcriptional regulator [Solirubrobacter soli]|uniref:MerR family transcriptional regulator n=1 Tax=Solirubrobacter soli TaxID=363832 RepID=UPI0004276B92|nr:MerR family transcriptional regulator [Solirubrobacter soli]
MRIGELAREAGVTPRTVRYYEEIGLLPESASRPAGSHREYGEEDLARLLELVRLKHTLGLSLDELKAVMHGEDERAQRRRAWNETSDPVEQRRLLDEALAHVDSLLALVGRRKEELETFEAELNERRQRVAHLLTEHVL